MRIRNVHESKNRQTVAVECCGLWVLKKKATPKNSLKHSKKTKRFGKLGKLKRNFKTPCLGGLFEPLANSKAPEDQVLDEAPEESPSVAAVGNLPEAMSNTQLIRLF